MFISCSPGVPDQGVSLEGRTLCLEFIGNPSEGAAVTVLQMIIEPLR